MYASNWDPGSLSSMEEATGNRVDFPPFTNLEELEEMAKKCLPKARFDFFAGGADDRITLEKNKESWKAIQLLPRYLVDVSNVDTSIELAG